MRVPPDALRLWYYVRTLAMILVAIGFFTRGPRRWVRIGLALLVVDYVLWVLVNQGPARAGFWLAALAAGLVAANFAGLSSWRAPRHIEYSQTTRGWTALAQSRCTRHRTLER